MYLSAHHAVTQTLTQIYSNACERPTHLMRTPEDDGAGHPGGFLRCDWKSYETESHRKWGRFPPHRIFNVDQVPLPFVVRV